MLQLFMYGLLLFFLLFYFLRGLLMVGYENLNYKNDLKKGGTIAKGLLQNLLTLKPLLQRKLTPKGVDYKVYARFEQKSAFYYWFLWITLFLLLFLMAKIYLDAF